MQCFFYLWLSRREHFRPIPAVPNRKKKLSAIDFLKSLTDKTRKVTKNTTNKNIAKYKNWMEAFPTTPTPPTATPTPARTSSPRIYPGRSQSRKVSLVSSQSTESDGGGVYVYLDPQRCFPRHLCKIPHDQFNQMVTLENEIEIL